MHAVLIGADNREVLVGGTPDSGAPDAGAGPGTEHSVLQDVTAASWESGVYPLVDDLNGGLKMIEGK